MDLPPHGPLDIALREYAWVIAVASWGGLVNWFAKLRAGGRFSLVELVGELVTSGFAGLAAFWILSSYQAPGLLTAALVGVAGHMGTRSLFLFENYLARRFARYTDALCKDRDGHEKSSD